ncbi:NAD-dependent epimerase/dehydratase family protein [Serinibacter arcticus]|nr:NAD-dependent epimerase/dehydratase family protein [Serinibacter arcticus]
MSTTPDAVVLGHGPVGATIAAHLLDQGRTVRVVTRSGSGPEGAERVRADVLDHDAVARAIGDAPAVHMAFHAPYDARTWSRMLPTMEAGVLAHTARTGAAVATAESLYAFDPAASPFTAASPLRPPSRKGAVRRTLLAARDVSGARVTSVVAGDFVGPRVLMSHAGERMMLPLLRGGTFRPVGDVDLPHAFTHVPDLAAAMVAATQSVRGDGEGGHRVVLAPHAGSITMRDLVARVAAAAGVTAPRLAPMSQRLLSAVGLVTPSVREIAEVTYQFTQAFEIDVDAATADARTLGLTATPWSTAIAETVAWWQARTAVAA